MTPPDPRLDLLFARYWDAALTPAEATELNARLRHDPDARERFRAFCLQATAAADWFRLHPVAAADTPLPADPTPPDARPAPPPTATPRASRRQWPVGMGAGALAGGVGTGLVGRFVGFPSGGDHPVTVQHTRGHVTLADTRTGNLTPGRVVYPGETVATVGPGSAAVLRCSDGSTVSLSAESAVAVAGTGSRLIVRRGGISADLRPADDNPAAVTLSTAVAAVTSGGGAVLAVGAEAAATDVQVINGQVNVSGTRGERIALVRGGELLTVRADGEHTKRAVPRVPTEYALDLTTALPEGWHVGFREETADGPAVRPQFWYDPYHAAVLSQIRSHKAWARGLARLHPDSLVRFRYQADQGGRGQVCLVVRTETTRTPLTGVLEWNDRFEATRAGEWRTVEVRADALLDCKEVPKFDPPWVAFLLIFNTYDVDINLRVGEFRVSRPGARDGG